MRLALRLSLVALALATSLGALTPIARTVCAGPTLHVRPKTVQAGDRITIAGRGWSSQCNDTGSCSVGCFGESCEGGGPSPPVENLVLTLVQVGQQGPVVVLADDVDARANLRFRVVATIPPDLEPERYVVTASNARGHRETADRPVTVIAPDEHG